MLIRREEGLALRGTFVINPEGQIKTIEVHDNGIGRDAKETAAQGEGRPVRRRAPGRSLPAKWNEGAETLTPSLDLVGKI